MPILTYPRQTIPMRRAALNPDDLAYRAAWKRFWKASAKLGKLWRTKKSALQILREERER